MQLITSLGYNIYIGNAFYKELNAFLARNDYSKYFIICDENSFSNCYPLIASKCKKLSTAGIIEIDCGESSKSLEICEGIWETLLEDNADKNTLMINIGGGVISDLGGFSASVYKRGIDFINIPTSVLAMADASVGGKTGIDFANIKNVIGTITQPKAVFINLDFLSTLPPRQFMNGLAEIFKIALISDRKFWDSIKINYKALSIEDLVYKSVTLKNKFVLEDPHEKNQRKALNFGHTIGHAVEAILLSTKDELLHGEAIMVGMIAESYLSFKKKLISKDELISIINCFTTNFTLTPIRTKHFGPILSLIKNDKKSKKGKANFVLLDKIGSFKINQVVTEAQILSSLEFYNSILHDRSHLT